MVRRWPAVTACLLGLLQVTAFPPLGWYPVGVLALAGLFLMLDEGTPAVGARTGFAFGVGLFGGGTYWLFTAIHGFGHAPVALALFLMAGLVALMSAWYALLGYLTRRWFSHPGRLRWLVVLPGGWVLVEWARSHAFTGFPWLTLGYTQVDTWLAGYAPVGGVYLVTLATAVCAGAMGVGRWVCSLGLLASVAVWWQCHGPTRMASRWVWPLFRALSRKTSNGRQRNVMPRSRFTVIYPSQYGAPHWWSGPKRRCRCWQKKPHHSCVSSGVQPAVRAPRC